MSIPQVSDSVTPAPETQLPTVEETVNKTSEKNMEHWIWIRIRLFVFLFLLYIASIGPCFWWWYESRFLDAPIWVAVFYEPLFRLCQAVPWLGEIVSIYINWWTS